MMHPRDRSALRAGNSLLGPKPASRSEWDPAGMSRPPRRVGGVESLVRFVQPGSDALLGSGPFDDDRACNRPLVCRSRKRNEQ
jgi:hypothetical protein